jgi:hypothetical protein
MAKLNEKQFGEAFMCKNRQSVVLFAACFVISLAAA